MGDHANQKQGVAVRRRFGHVLGADQRVAPRPVVDNHRVFHGVGELGGQCAGDKIRRAAGGERHDDANRLSRCGKALRLCKTGAGASHRCEQGTDRDQGKERHRELR